MASTLFVLLIVLLHNARAFVMFKAPTARIVVHVRERRQHYWDVWQLNSRVCPPSLCQKPTDEVDGPGPTAKPTRRPQGTGGTLFYQGDIILDEEIDRYIYPSRYNRSRSKRATMRLRNKLWKDGVVPYTFGKDISARAKRVILRAFKHITQRTCVTFREKKKSDSDYVEFISDPGCWSSIGKTGNGKQLLSLGRGCENIGTAVHEIVHSLGVWHEQARKDRDKYVAIMEENISDRFLEDFEKVPDEAQTSRGFPYDYLSVMHYSKFAFTRNGMPTIEVIGVGKELGLTIKQRNGLSAIDMAQLRDMYRCNLRTDTNQTRCPEGWFKHERSCYRFFERPRAQFAAASKKCLELNSHLVFIETMREDMFLADHLLKTFPHVYTWRTGGRVISGSMKWYREDSSPADMEHSSWGPGQPASFTTTALRRDPATNNTQWVGVWAGSSRQFPLHAHSFICERRARRDCLRLQFRDGRDYRGKLDHTVDGYTCQKWTDHYPHPHNLTDRANADSNDNNEDRASVRQDSDGLGNHNFCRNPRQQRRSRPWCYTTKKTHQWQFCDVSTCVR